MEFLRGIPLFATILGMGWNLTFALINLIFSVFYRSYWYLTLFAIYLVLGLMKMSTVTLSRSQKRTESNMLLQNGFAMLILSVIECGMMLLTIREVHNPAMNKVVLIFTAVYTFAFVGNAIRIAVKVRKRKTSLLIALRNISCASVSVSLLSLERSMLGTFGDGSNNDSLVIEAWTGAVTFLFLLCLAFNFIILSLRIKNTEKTQRKINHE